MSDQFTVRGNNLGPLESVEFTLEGPGVTVVYAPNGAGKSILGEAVSSAMSGSGMVPVSDGASRGSLNAFGVTVTFGARTRYGGRLAVTSLAGRFDLAKFVDPKIKDEPAADRARIRQLLLLRAPEVSDKPFRESGLFPDFDDVVNSKSKDATDYVEMGDRIKRSYEAASRKATDEAAKHSAEAQVCQAIIDDVPDLLAESGESVLVERYNAARDEVTRLTAEAKTEESRQVRLDAARKRLDELHRSYQGPTVQEAQATLGAACVARQYADDRVKQLAAELRQAETRLIECEAQERIAEAKLRAAQQYVGGIRACESVLTSAEGSPIDAMAVAEKFRKSQEGMAAAQVAMAIGAQVREAWGRRLLKRDCTAKFIASDKRASDYRNAALAVGDVLSGLVAFPSLKVSHGRLRVVGHSRGEGTLFHELSQGEQYRFGLELVVSALGRGGVAVLSQEGWESLDAFVRQEIHELAKSLGVHVLSLEATPKQSMGRAMVVKRYEPEV